MTRLLAQMQTSVVTAGVRTLDGDLDRFMIFALIVRQTLSGTEASPISTLAIANSLSRPYETVRRHVQALISLGFCVRVPRGIIAPPSALECPQVSALMRLTHDWFVRFVENLALLSMPLPQPRNGVGYHPSVGIGAVADIFFSVADGNRAVHRDWAGLVLFSVILCANTREFALDPERARLYGDETREVPDELHCPVRTSVIARVSGMTETTVRRRVAAMLEEGMVERRPRGLLVRQQWLNRPESIETSRASYHNIRRILERAAAAGFPFSDPASAYLVGRPPDATF